jgi:hypothetical protein
MALSMISFYYTANAQITLEHTFDTVVNWSGSYYSEQYTLPFQSYYNSKVDGNSYIVKIYNSDFSVNSINTYNFNPPAGYKVSTVSMTRQLFNTDNNFEFLVSYVRIDNVNDNTRQQLILHNQNGTIIKDFGMAYIIGASSLLHIVGNGFRFLVHKMNYNDLNLSTQVEIYSVPGTPASLDQGIKSGLYQAPYPNPANTIITLPYQLQQGESSAMNIFNINGQLLETKKIDSAFEKILLNVSNYSRGIYIYEVNGLSNKFIVE